MKMAGKRASSAPIGKLISLLVIATAIGIAIYVARRNAVMPWTDAATIDADVVHVAAAIGGIWVGIVGYLRHARGVNETISSLLLTYIGIAIMNFFVEGALRDLSNPNKPSTRPLGDAYMLPKIPGTDVHWGLAVGIFLAILLQILLSRTTFGFAVRVAGGNARAALAMAPQVAVLMAVELGRDGTWQNEQVASFANIARGYLLPHAV